jgi:alpha-galactosidase
VIHEGDLYRLISPWKTRTRSARSFVSPDKREVLVTYVVIRAEVSERHVVRLQGLDPEKMYRDRTTGLVLSGAALMNAGLNLQGTFTDLTSRIIHLIAEE